MNRITKAKARKMFNNGETVTIVPHKVNPNNVWGIGMAIQKDAIANTLYGQTYNTQGFNWWINNFTECNCCFESGYYVAYYIEG